jgi:hypothetical protein
MGYKVFLIIVLVLFLSGCTGISPGGQQAQAGQRGIGIMFLPYMPPNELELGEQFNVEVELTNYLSTPTTGKITIYDDLAPEYSAIPKTSGTFDLAEPFYSTPNAISFDKTSVLFEDLRYDPRISQTSTRITTVVEYDATFRFSAQTCVAGRNAISKCPTEGPYLKDSFTDDITHAPVAVTNIKKYLSPGTSKTIVTLEMDIQDVGGGEINNQDQTVSDISVGSPEYPFTCPKILSFKKTKYQNIKCRAEIQVNPDEYFQIPVRIRFTYPYKQAYFKDVLLKESSFLEEGNY